MTKLRLENNKKTSEWARAMSSLIASGRLSNSMAEELQEPINAIIDSTSSTNALLLELARDLSTDNEGILDIVNIIEENLTRIDEQASQAYKMLMRMQQSSGGELSTPQATDVHNLLLECLSLARKQHGDFKVRVEQKFDPSIEPILSHEPELAKAFTHIMDNALEAMQEKAQTTKNYAPTLALETKLRDGQLLISIIDNGVGIPAELHEQIFEQFYTTKQDAKHLGLGLTTVREVVEELANGEVEVDSGPEWGTSIDITLNVRNG